MLPASRRMQAITAEDRMAESFVTFTPALLITDADVTNGFSVPDQRSFHFGSAARRSESICSIIPISSLSSAGQPAS